jgi:hypothetical protein
MWQFFYLKKLPKYSNTMILEYWSCLSLISLPYAVDQKLAQPPPPPQRSRARLHPRCPGVVLFGSWTPDFRLLTVPRPLGSRSSTPWTSRESSRRELTVPETNEPSAGDLCVGSRGNDDARGAHRGRGRGAVRTSRTYFHFFHQTFGLSLAQNLSTTPTSVKNLAFITSNVNPNW